MQVPQTPFARRSVPEARAVHCRDDMKIPRASIVTPISALLLLTGGLLIGASTATAIGCTSSSGASPGDAGATSDADPDDDDPPDVKYGACAVKGSFGAPCTADANGPDPSECTDPRYPICNVGGQGSWCSRSCTSAADCASGSVDAGCTPTGCNKKSNCK
jgi:hypothetical protein